MLQKLIRTASEYLTNPKALQTIANVARGIRMGAEKVNEASGGLLKAGVEALPFGRSALKVADVGLRGAEALARHLQRRFTPMSDTLG